jgi:CDP-glycerol glycerophosphotransferase
MVSGCRVQTELLRRSFWYDGAILECGIPRNDIFFRTELHPSMREQIGQRYGIAPDSHIVLYAPTFRRNHSTAPYRIDWQAVLPHLRTFFGGDEVVVLLRLHPNLLGRIDVSSLTRCPQVIDVTRHHDMQELLCVSEMLITDYSSSMFDFTMLRRPCLLYAPDVEQYDRGYYFDFRDLPYPLACTQQSLIHAIDTFDHDVYDKALATFFDERIQLTDNGHACASLAEWMASHATT